LYSNCTACHYIVLLSACFIVTRNIVKSGTCLLLICTKLMSLGITVSEKFFNACWGESAKPLSYYCNTMSASLLIDQRKILFYKKTICGSNVVLRTVCSLYFNEIQRLFSAYNILPWHTSYIDVKRTFWSFFYFIAVNLVCSLCLFLYCSFSSCIHFGCIICLSFCLLSVLHC